MCSCLVVVAASQAGPKARESARVTWWPLGGGGARCSGAWNALWRSAGRRIQHANPAPEREHGPVSS